MISLALAVLSLQKPQIAPTERDRDVITAYLFSARNENVKQPLYYVVVPFSDGGVSRLCMDAFQKNGQGTATEKEQWATGLKERNTSRVRIDGLKWDKKIVFCDVLDNLDRRLFMSSEFRKLFTRDVNCYSFNLPGYSTDGKSAVVVTWVGPNHIHHVREVAILNLSEGKWRVTWRQLAYAL